MPNLIVSTCGTSIFSGNADADIRTVLVQFANAKTVADISPDVLPRLQAHIQQRSAELMQVTSLHTLTERSAELACLVAFYGNALRGKDHHILLATDTWLSEQAAQTLACILQHYGHSTEVKRCTDLRTDDLGAYRAALSELVRWAYQDLKGYRAGGHRIIFNLTGGFKAVQGFMQTLGALLADECVYSFERSAELIRIPRLPVEMRPESYVIDNLTAFRRMSLGLNVMQSQALSVPELLLLTVDDQVALSEWGELVWGGVRESIYGAMLRPSPSPKLQFGSGFAESAEGLDERRIRQISIKVDDLARFIETGQSLRSLDFKIIKAGPRKGSTHEIDAWHDGDAKRLFGHYANEIFVLDRLDAALH